MNLVIVESPAKGKTIEKYLGSGYKVMASFGHVRDLPKSKIGIDVENGFEPEYVTPIKAKKTLTALKTAAKSADKVLLATDPDREGEAISWHLKEALGLKDKDYDRIEFHEITKDAVVFASKHPRKINDDLVDAQQARRVLDRLVGYNLSPLLWRKIRKGLSAGRVQSVAVKLIVDREREIQDFKPVEYWEISADLKNDGHEFNARLAKKDGVNVEISNKQTADGILADLEKASYIVDRVETKDVKRSPAAPFTTSTLQQEAARKLRYSSKRTMAIAQQLYEGIDVGEGSQGLITYMRTDAVNLSSQALGEIRAYIEQKFSSEFLPKTPRLYKKSKSAQEAHEAIRPTSVMRTPDSIKQYLAPDQFKLYELIWKRTVASQMADAIYAQTSVDIKADSYMLRASGRTIKFAGFMSVYLEDNDEKEGSEAAEFKLPKLAEGSKCDLVKLNSDQKFTEPPARYTEASLIKTLEENGIGRPSTYAPTISTIQDRGYVRLEQRKFYPEDIAFIVTDMLRDHFPFVVSVDFTANMEKELDEIAEGKMDWVLVMQEFWNPFKDDLDKAQTNVEKINTDRATEEVCDKCGKPMVIKHGRFGEFLACTGFPECKNAKPLPQKSLGKCPECKEGDIVERKTKRGKKFWGCSRYPECKWATWDKPKGPEADTPDK